MYEVGAIRARLGADTEAKGFIDFDRLYEDAKKKETKPVKVPLKGDPDPKGFKEYDQMLVKARLASKAIKAELGADVDEGAFQAYYAELDKAKVRAKAQSAFKAHLGADYDEGAFRAYERALSGARKQQAAAEGGNRSFLRSSKDVSLGLVDLSSRLPLVRWGAFAAGAYSALAPILALTGAIGPMVGLVGAIPGALAAAGAGLGATMLGLRGVGDALSETWQSQLTASQDGAKAAKTAQSAVDGVADAERRLQDANREARYAQEDVNEAREEAARQLVDLRLAALGAALGEKEAALALRRAKDELIEVETGGGSPTERRGALLAVERAEIGLREARVQRARSEREAQEADRQGIERSEQVVQAKRRAADADRAVADAVRGVAEASDAATEALTATGGASDALQEKLNDLSPAGREFVTLVRDDLFPLAKRLQATAQQGLLPGLGEGLLLASKNVDVLDAGLGRISRTLGGGARDWGAALGSPQAGRDMQQILANSDRLLASGARASIDFGSGLRHVAISAGELQENLGDAAEELAENFDQWAEAGRESGRLEAFFRRTWTATREVVGALWDFGAGLVNVASIGRRVWGGDMLHDIREGAEAFREWTESREGVAELTRWFEVWRRRWTEVTNAIGDAVEEYRRLRREGLSSTEALTQVLVDKFSEAFVTLAERVGRLAPKVVAGFIKGFLEADAWGKLAIGVWLISKMGGRAAWVAIGKTVGGWFGLSMGRTAAATAAPATVSGMIGGGGAGGRWSKLGLTIGRLLGPAMALYTVIAFKDEIETGASDLANWFYGQFGGDPIAPSTGGLSPDDTRPRMAPPGTRRSQAGPGAPELFTAPDGRVWQKNEKTGDFDLIKAGKEFKDLNKLATREMREMRRNTGDAAHGARADIEDETKRAQRASTRAFRDQARDIEESVRKGRLTTREGFAAIERLVDQHSDGANRAARRRFRDMGVGVKERMKTTRDTTSRQMDSLKDAVTGGLDLTVDAVNSTLRGLGLKPIKFTSKGPTIGGKAVKPLKDLSEFDAGGGYAGMPDPYAGGGMVRPNGWVGRMGAKGRDLVHAVVGRGEAILNWSQQAMVNMGLRRGGIRGGLDEVFSRTRGSRHALAEGGYADGGAYAGGGIVPVPGFPGEYAATSVLDEIAWVAKHFPGLVLTDAYGQGHTSPGHTVYGTAADFSGPDASMDAAVAALVKKGFPVLYDGRFGSTSWPDHGPSYVTPNFHFHVEFGGNSGVIKGGAAAPGVSIPEIGRASIGGPDGPLKSIGQALLNKAHSQLMRAMGARHGELTGPGAPSVGAGVLLDLEPTESLEAINKRYPSHTSSTTAGHVQFSENLMNRIIRWAGLPSYFLQIAKGESAYYPGNTGYDPGGTIGYGLWQETPGTWGGPGNALYDFMLSLGGEHELWNPLKNAKMAKFHYDNAPSQTPNTPGFPWYGTAYLSEGGYPFAGSFAGGKQGYKFNNPDLSPISGAGRGLGDFDTKIQALEDEYTRKEKRYDVSDEMTVVGPGDPGYNEQAAIQAGRFQIEDGKQVGLNYLNQDAIKARKRELRSLTLIRKKIKDTYQAYWEAIQKIVVQYEVGIKKMRSSIQALPKKKRKKYRDDLDQMRRALAGWRGRLGEVGNMKYDAETNWMDARQEYLAVTGDAEADLTTPNEPSASSGSDDEDLRTQLEVLQRQLTAANETARVTRAGFGVINGPGDIGAGGLTAAQAVANPYGGGPIGQGYSMGADGRVYANATGGLAQFESEPGGGGQFVQNNYMLHPGDPGVLDAIGRAATAGQSMQGASSPARVRVNI